MIYYSPEKRGFFDSGIHAHIPPDAVELKPGEHESLLAAQSAGKAIVPSASGPVAVDPVPTTEEALRSEEHTSELQSLMRISYAVFCLKKKKNINTRHST